MSKQFAIRNQTDLVQEFRKLLKEDPHLRWEIQPSESAGGVIDSVHLIIDERVVRLTPHFWTSPTAAELSLLGSDVPEPVTDKLPLLVTPNLTTNILDRCRKRHISALDLNGRAYLRAAGLLVDRAALPGRDYRFDLEPQNIFVGKSARILRSLLARPDHLWTQGELVKRVGASSGLVSRIVNHLIRQGFLEKQGTRKVKLCQSLPLLTSWAEADDFGRRVTTFRYAALGGVPLDLAVRLKALLAAHAIPAAFTQWIAGWLRRPYTEPVVVSAYVPRLPGDALLEKSGWRSVSEGGNIWLHVPDDEGVFLETQEVKGLQLVSDAQIYLDLQKAGLRGEDQARALRDWKGFCQP